MLRSRSCQLVLIACAAAACAPLAPLRLAAQVQQGEIALGLGGSFVDAQQDVYGLGGSVVYDRWVAGPRWAGVRVYAGGFLSRTNGSTCPVAVQACSVSSQIAVGGLKLRLLAPIPFVAPFLELGGGMSAGSIRARIDANGPFPAIDESRSGLTLHFPIGLGVAFGARHQHSLAFDYFVPPSRDHTTGTLSVGIGL